MFSTSSNSIYNHRCEISFIWLQYLTLSTRYFEENRVNIILQLLPLYQVLDARWHVDVLAYFFKFLQSIFRGNIAWNQFNRKDAALNQQQPPFPSHENLIFHSPKPPQEREQTNPSRKNSSSLLLALLVLG